MGVSYCFMMTKAANGFAVLSSSLHTSFYFTALCFITRQPCRRAARQPCQTLSFPIRSEKWEIYSTVKYQNNLMHAEEYQCIPYIVKMYSSMNVLKNKACEYLYSTGNC